MSGVDSPAKIRVVIVEDEPLFRDLLRVALSRHQHLEVLGAFGDGESALDAIPALSPNVAILDIELGGSMNGIKLGLLLRRQLPDVGIVLLSNYKEPQFVASLPSDAVAGWSYLFKRSVSDVATVTRAIEGAAARYVVLDPELVASRRPRPEGLLAHLTARQREIMELVAQGLTNAAIAQDLCLAEKTVENQINSLYQQLGVEHGRSSLHPRVQAVLLYLRESQAI